MNQKTKMEQKALDALNSLIQELVTTNGLLDMKKVLPEFYFNVLKKAYKTKKAPCRWTTDALNIEKNWFNKHTCKI